MINFILLSSLVHSFIVQAIPVYVFTTEDVAPAFVTVYDDGASPDDAVYSTDYQDAVSYTTTLWPSSSPIEYNTVLAETTQQAAANTEATVGTTSTTSTPSSTSTTPTSTSSTLTTSTTSIPTTSSTSSDSTTPTTPSSTSSRTTSTSSTSTSSVHVVTVSTTATTSITSTSPTSSTSSTSITGPAVTLLPKYMVYSPYNNDQSCKDANTVKTDLEYMVSKGVTRIRMYATDCNSLETVQPAASDLGMRISQGLWIGSSGTQNALNQLSDLITAANGDWSMYDSIIVGNEDITNGFVTADELVSLVDQVRSELTSAGYTGDVIIAETTAAYLENPSQLCGSTFPFLGLNAHSYFATGFSAQQAGDFIANQISIVSAACSRSDIWISETGYPHKGNTNGLNVPTKQNQADALNAILAETDLDCVILAQYDDMWKEPGTYGIEQYFGMIDILV